MLANQRGGSPPTWDPLNSSSFFPAALESTDLILIIYGRHFLLPYLCCAYVPHRFHTSSPLYKWLSIGSPPTDLSTLTRPVLSSVLQPALVTSQSGRVLKQRVLAKALWRQRRKERGRSFNPHFIKSPGDILWGIIGNHRCPLMILKNFLLANKGSLKKVLWVTYCKMWSTML